jgi:transposase-like protein
LDVVENNTTASFLESFESYCNTYGRPAKCMTDAAGYFKKAAKTLKKTKQTQC